jgi:hypothetical protein
MFQLLFSKGLEMGDHLGYIPPSEITQALKMAPTDQCGLEGGAYGRIDAQFLCYQSFRESPESLGFMVCPLDGCVFSLVTQDAKGKPKVRGVLGIHVDDGMGGGDDYFMEVINRLKGKYSFGAFNTGEFDFCGIHYRQWRDGSIEMCQQKYIERIDPIQVCRHRRKEPQTPVTEAERQCLRQLYVAPFSMLLYRPDLTSAPRLEFSSHKFQRPV